MSNHIPQEGRGVLFMNLEKKGETHPDYKGQVMIDGKIVKLSAWKKTHANGHLFSISVQKRPETNVYPRELKDDDQEIPW